MVPDPRVPEMGGSSHMWRAARAATGAAGMRQYPSPAVSVRRALHCRGQRLQSTEVSSLFLESFAGDFAAPAASDFLDTPKKSPKKR